MSKNECYTYATVWGNNILYRGIENGRRITKKVPFGPTLYTKSRNGNKCDVTSLYGDSLEEHPFDDIQEAKDFIKKYKDLNGFEIHGMEQFQYQFLNEKFPNKIEYDTSLMKVVALDLETETISGFPNIETANERINLISLVDRTTRQVTVFSFQSAEVSPEVDFRVYRTEELMLRAFLEYWESDFPDIVTSWNGDTFDFPYIINRIARVLGESHIKRLSPFNSITERKIEIYGKDVQTYDILGIVQLDYLQLMKKFTYGQRESWSLGAVTQDELGETKVENPYKSFREFYENAWDLFVSYNIKDSVLVHKLDDKMKLIDLIISIAYLVKCNFKDVFGPVKTWDVFVYNYLSKKNIACPPHQSKAGAGFEGAYVKDPVPGFYGWTVSFDFASLYPTIIRQWNMSPETIQPYGVETSVEKIANNQGYFSEAFVPENNKFSVAANGSIFSKDKDGILPQLMAYLMEGRKIDKREMLKLEAEYQSTHDESLVPKIAALNNSQMALKILANSGYGVVSSPAFRYFYLKIAEAITLTGQASDKHLERSFNEYLNKAMKTKRDWVCYMDTDSVYLDLQPIVNRFCKNMTTKQIVDWVDNFCEEILQKIVDKSVAEVFERCNCKTKLMAAKREAIADKCLWTGKKRYAMRVHNSEGVAYDPPKMKIMGMDIIKTSTPHVIRADLKGLLSLMFDTDEPTTQAKIKEIKKEFMKLPVEDIAFPRGVTDLDKYYKPKGEQLIYHTADFFGKDADYTGKMYKPGCPIHVRGSILYNGLLHEAETPIRNGDKIKFIYLKVPNPINEDVIAFPVEGRIPEKLLPYVDKETQFEKTFLKPATGLLDAAGWTVEELFTLEGFFV